MKKVLSWILMFVLILALAGCGAKGPAANEANGGADSAEPKQSQTTGDLKKPQNETAANSKTLSDSYPKEILPLAADAEILDVRENPANKGLQVSYVSDNDIETLCDFYEGALKNAIDLSTEETSDGYMISAKLDGVGYTIMLSKDAMNSNPRYAGKKSVYIILTGLEGVSGGHKMSEDEGEEWPSADLPGVPQLKGHIDKILREDGVIWLEITVENAEKVKSYVRELTAAGFSFDAEPDTKSDNVQLVAFKGNSILNFDYDAGENYVNIEYHK
jgi:predicted small lipoprotein YifL